MSQHEVDRFKVIVLNGIVDLVRNGSDDFRGEVEKLCRPFLDLADVPYPTNSAEALEALYSYWGEHPDYPRDDWRYECSNNDTGQAYWDWVEREIWSNAEDEEPNE